MNLSDAKPPMLVRYIPWHADGDRTHPDCEDGRVSSVNDKFVFVKFNKQVSKDGTTSQACDPATLIPLEPFFVNPLQSYADKIMAHGPNRVVINREGDAYSSERALEQYGINPTVIFIRNDGWSLGAPEHLEDTARKLWDGQWIGVLRKPSTVAEPIERETK